MRSKKRFLFTTQPASHMQAMLPVARELQSRGHDVAFASAKSFRGRVEEAGFEFLSAGFDWLESRVADSFPEVAEVGLDRVNLFFMRKLFADKLAYPMIDDLLGIGARWQPDVIVRQQWEFGGCVAAEKLQIPHALMSCGQNFRIWEHMVADRLEDLRAHYGLDPDPKLEMLYRYLYLDYLPPSFQFPSLDIQRTLQLCRGDVADAVPRGQASEWLATFDERPLVYVTAGTTFNELPGYFDTILEALASENLNVIVTTGRPSVAEALKNRVSRNVRVEAFVPQDHILHRASLMISHGGLNTLLGAFHRGVPVLTIPVAADMGQNGLRAEQLGCGLCIPYHSSVATYPRCEPLLDARRFTVDNVRAAVRQILGESAFRDAAMQLRHELRRMPGPEHGADLLERLANERRPILSESENGDRSTFAPSGRVDSQMTGSPELAIFGGTGFIGKRFCELSRHAVEIVPREQRKARARDVLYLISTTDNYGVFDDVKRDVDVNLTVLLEVLDALKGGDHRITFVSSWFVYGNTELPAREDSPCAPRGFYSITKHTAERLLISFCETFKIPYRIVRLCNVYGPSDGGVSKRKNALQFLIGELRENRDISLYHGGDFLRDYMHVDDVVSALDCCLENAPWGTITNIGSGDRVRFRDLIEHASRLLGSSAQISSMEPPEFHRLVQVRDFAMDTSRLRSFGFLPKITIQEGIAQLCRR